MAQIFNPQFKGEAIARSEANQDTIMVRRRKAEKRAGSAYLNRVHLYELFIGNECTGERKRMLGRDAQMQNKLYELEFGAGKRERLHKWVWQRKEEEKSKQSATAILAMRS